MIATVFEVLYVTPTRKASFLYGTFDSLNKAQLACMRVNRLLFLEGKYNQQNFAYVYVKGIDFGDSDELPF